MGKVLSAQGSGYFPVCIPEGETYPYQPTIPLTLEQAMALFWRVKVWEAKISGQWAIPSDGAFVYYTYFDGDSYEDMAISGNTPEINSEEQYICNGAEIFLYERGVYLGVEYPDGNSYSYELGLYLQYCFSDNFNTRRNGKTYYPFIVLGTGNSFSDGASNTAVIGSFNFKLLNDTFTGPIYTIVPTATGSVQIDIRAKEYWPYGGTYDTTTGNPL